MKRNFYLQHSLMAMFDPRIKKLVEEEGCRGYGAYWIIIEKLAILPEPCGTFEYLQGTCVSKKVPLWYLKKIVSDFQLFDFLEDGSFIPCELNPPRDLQKEIEENKRKTAKSVEEKPVSETKNDENVQKVSRQTGKKNSKNSPKVPKTSVLQKTSSSNTKENIKDIIITTATTESKDTAAAAEISDEVFQSPLLPVRPWREMVGSLAQESSWIEIAYMQSGYSALLKRNIEQAIKIFTLHIEAYDKGGDLLNMRQVHGYFMNFVRAGSRTSIALRQKLIEHEAQNPSATVDDPYRHEQRIDGRRTYLGCPIPAYAPPRPSETALWNDSTRSWVSPQSTHLSVPNHTPQQGKPRTSAG